MEKNNKIIGTIRKEDFIDFLATATPEEVNKYILEKGKPRKPIEPMVFFKSKEDETKK